MGSSPEHHFIHKLLNPFPHFVVKSYYEVYSLLRSASKGLMTFMDIQIDILHIKNNTTI